MPTTLEDIHRKIIRETPVADRLRGLTPREILKLVPLEEFLQSVSEDEIDECLLKTKEKRATKPKPGRRRK
jgi:hypothetical protein